jgi:dTDP-4-dehydrorhamnose 3,5-epimerase
LRVAQVNLSQSKAGVLRGMHFHRRQSDLWCPIEGRMFVALFDLRRGSPTEGRAFTLEFDPSLGLRTLSIPPGVAHGFCAITDARLLYLVDAEFTGQDEFGFVWSDPDAGIGWPSEAPFLSERDRQAPSLASVLEDPPAFVGGPT